MFNKKRPVLTATTCTEMEKLRLAIEVLTGKAARFVQLDFNTGRGIVSIDGIAREVYYSSSREDILHFRIGIHDNTWQLARFDDEDTVRVCDEFVPAKRLHRGVAVWQVGRSATDRWLEPFYMEATERYAKELGLTVQELLST